MLTKQRKELLLRILKEEGQIVARTLSESLGLSEDPPAVLLSRSMDLPWDAGLLADAAQPVLVYTSSELNPPETAAPVTVVRAADPAAMLADRLFLIDHFLANGIALHLHHPEPAIAVELGHNGVLHQGLGRHQRRLACECSRLPDNEAHLLCESRAAKKLRPVQSRRLGTKVRLFPRVVCLVDVFILGEAQVFFRDGVLQFHDLPVGPAAAPPLESHPQAIQLRLAQPGQW